MIISKIKLGPIWLCLSMSVLSACTSTSIEDLFRSERPDTELSKDPRALLADTSLHTYAAKLVTQLTSQHARVLRQTPIAIGTFLPDSGIASPQQTSMGNQFQQSVNTLLVQAGYTVEEYKLRNGIKIYPDRDEVLSRQIKALKSEVSAGYILAGTINPQQESTQINARIIEVGSRTVIAAGTVYVPNNLMWSEEKLKQRNGYLIRTQY